MLVTVIVFLLILSVLVLVHEFGHFTAAKKMGIKVEEFGFGLPPRMFGIKRGETIYSINWLPIGGFVKLFGEEGDTDIAGKNPKSSEVQKRAFYTRPVWQRAIVLVAGVAMNFVLAIVVISYLFTQGVMVPTNRIHIENVMSNSPAAQAGLQKNDVIKSVSWSNNGMALKSSDDLIKFTRDHAGEKIDLTVLRGASTLQLFIIPRKVYPKDQGPMGIVISNYEEKKYPLWQAPVLGTKESIALTGELLKGIGTTIWKLISFQPVSKDVAGPIGIAQMTGQAVKTGESAVLELLGLLSLNLAIVNILPFPALDGGRLLFVVVEAVTGKKIKTNWERYIHQVGMVILLLLMVLVTINDLVRIFAK
ncbi:MAG: RIP metalloprotease RseP [Patescibacteria group bacterium]|nr:RIP metalloprotease RseP [Patescibacteria group bacterium]